MVQKVVQCCDSISEWTGRSVAWLIWIVMGLCVFEVITRRIFNSPNIWTYDVITAFYSVNFMIMGGYTLLKKGHVSVDIFSALISKKKQALLQITTYFVFFFPFVIVLFYVGSKSAIQSWGDFQRTATGLILIAPIMKTCIPLASLILFIQGIPEVIRNVRIVKEEQPDV